MLERRASERHRTLTGAKIAFKGSVSAIHCIVRNLSETGACIRVETVLGIPDDFDLVFDDPHLTYHCRAIWRKETLIGVRFTTKSEFDLTGR